LRCIAQPNSSRAAWWRTTGNRNKGNVGPRTPRHTLSSEAVPRLTSGRNGETGSRCQRTAGENCLAWVPLFQMPRSKFCPRVLVHNGDSTTGDLDGSQSNSTRYKQSFSNVRLQRATSVPVKGSSDPQIADSTERPTNQRHDRFHSSYSTTSRTVRGAHVTCGSGALIKRSGAIDVRVKPCFSTACKVIGNYFDVGQRSQPGPRLAFIVRRQA
jgi:hypothetical protein